MFCNDTRIEELALEGMIVPFIPTQIHQANLCRELISYGLSSHGYDLRLSSKEFKIFRRIPGKCVDPKDFDPKNMEDVELQEDSHGRFYIVPANSYALGVAVERLSLPENIFALCIGKSTYARVGIIANITPVEAGWQGHLTIELSNSSSADCRVYADEGIIQIAFAECRTCAVSYAARKGKYQNQSEEITMAKV